ncbi:uncharacterized protein ACR2FA_006865 [Aphomia sociella]
MYLELRMDNTKVDQTLQCYGAVETTSSKQSCVEWYRLASNFKDETASIRPTVIIEIYKAYSFIPLPASSTAHVIYYGLYINNARHANRHPPAGVNILNMFLYEILVSSKAMRLFTLVAAFFSLSANCAELPIFNKCCPEDQNLIKVSVDLNTTLDVRYTCLSSEIKNNYNISSDIIPLLLVHKENVAFYMPEECELQSIHAIGGKVELTTEENDICYDRLVMEIVNDTSKQIIPKTVALTCIRNETSNETIPTFTIDHIRKCCPTGQRYDMVYHACRNFEENSESDWFIQQLLNNNKSEVYEVDFGLHCKSNEYAIELSEDKFMLEVLRSELIVRNIISGKNKGRAPRGEWCIDRGYSNEGLVARVCTDNCSKYDAYCVRKCCPVGEHYKPRRCGSFISSCVPNNATDNAELFNISSYMDPLKEYHRDLEDTLGIRSNLVCPLGKVALNRSSKDDFHRLTPSGKLESPIAIDYDYCIETFDTRDCQGEVTVSAVVCFVGAPYHKDFRFSFVLICMSSVCLTLTLLVYCTLPELKNQHGRTLTCHLCMMLLAYSCLARVQYDVVANNTVCTLLGYLIYFGFVAAFAWLNVMCIDIWWTFGASSMSFKFAGDWCESQFNDNSQFTEELSLYDISEFKSSSLLFIADKTIILDVPDKASLHSEPDDPFLKLVAEAHVRTRTMQKAKSQRRKFLWYSIYAWGVAVILTLVTFLLDRYPVTFYLDSNIGNGRCWFEAVQNDKSDWPHYILFVAPMGIVTCTNFILWVLTARHCARVKAEMHRLQAGSVGDRAKRRFRVDQAKYILTGKLWVVMGAGWISELLSTLAHEPKWLWFVIDLLNELQGVFIFIILICKPKLYRLIRKRLGLEKPDAQKSGPSSSARTSSTYLSRTISNDERAALRISLPNNVKQN